MPHSPFDLLLCSCRMKTYTILITLIALSLLAGCQPVTPVPVEATAARDPVTTVIAAGAPAILTPLVSPDDQWRAEVAAYACTPTVEDGEMAYEQLTLTHITTSAETVVATQTIACGGLGAYGLAGLFWSANSRYLYYTTGREGVPDGCGYWARPITRLDVTTLATTDLGGGVLSSDQTRLAAWQGRELALWDVEGGEITRMTAAQTALLPGPIAWSPDGHALVYLQVESYCPLTGVSALIHVDLPTTTQSVMLESSTPTFGSVRWDDPNALILVDEHGAAWRFHLTTQDLDPLPN